LGLRVSPCPNPKRRRGRRNPKGISLAVATGPLKLRSIWTDSFSKISSTGRLLLEEFCYSHQSTQRDWRRVKSSILYPLSSSGLALRHGIVAIRFWPAPDFDSPENAERKD
jgi:hypothetical protein